MEPVWVFYFLLIPLAFASAVFLRNTMAGLVVLIWTEGQLAWLAQAYGWMTYNHYVIVLAVSYGVAFALAWWLADDKPGRMIAAIYLPLCATATFEATGAMTPTDAWWAI